MGARSAYISGGFPFAFLAVISDLRPKLLLIFAVSEGGEALFLF